MPQIGELLGGRYRLIEPLGEGGMATIYRAHDEQLGRDVAVKVLRPEYGRDSAFVARFRQEAQAAASLNHPNVVNVFDYGTDRGVPFIVMELIDGGDLQSLIREEAPLPPIAAAEIARQIADALAAAHARGIVHRDIKPSNVLLASGGRVKVVDFGIARAFSEAQLTLPGTTLGSVHYFSPEQARGETVTPSSDLYSLGLVLFEMITGQRAWRGESPAAVAMARLAGEAPAPSTLQPSVPRGLDLIVRRALARDPEDRYPSASAFSQALQRFVESPNAPVRAAAAAMPLAGSNPTVVSRAAPRPQPRPAMAQAAASAAIPARGTYSGRRDLRDEEEERGGGAGAWGWAAAILALLLLVAGAVLIFLFLNRSGGGVALPSSSPTPVPVAVPDLVGLQFQQAETVARAAGLRVSVEGTELTDQFPENTVTAQRPERGTMVAPGGDIFVTIATTKQTVTVPDLRNMSEAQALAEIQRAELQAGTKTQAYDTQIARGAVVSTNPRAGAEVAKGTAIDYVVSRGPRPTPSPTPRPTPTPAPVTVGNYCQLDLKTARLRIQLDHLRVGDVTPPGYKENYTVIDQNPLPGEKVPRNTPVDLRVLPPESAPAGPCISATPSPSP
jgi:beta-lactam-binding protein with PASTA domain/tRNA A-37 threonylcarbamoyl transferase component Bud32